jgi:transcriptional regulator with XRE-family HTH domain
MLCQDGRRCRVSLRELRLGRQLTLEAVSVLAGVDVATISRIERGLVEARPETIVRLAKGLGISAKRLQAMLAEVDVEAVAQ